MPHTASLVGLGWKIKVQERKRNYLITLAKEIVLGNIIHKGDELYYYLVNIDGRKAIVVLLDQKPLDTHEDILIKE